MDVLYPELEDIDGSIYRINVIDELNIGRDAEKLHYTEYDEENENECISEIIQSENEEDENDRIVTDNGNYRIQFHVAKLYIPHIIGHKGSTLQRLILETETSIKIPQKNEHGDVVIIGKRRNLVSRAYDRIQIIINRSRQKQQPTHFISIPMNTNIKLREKFDQFKKSVLEIFGQDRGISENIFQKPMKLHLTVAVLVLADDVERKNVINVLKKCRNLFSDSVINNKLVIHVRGVECMNDDPSEVRVLFGKIVTPNEKLQYFVDNIINVFSEEGIFLKNDDRNVKLHLTLMNTTFSEENYTEFKTKNFRTSFDARNILQNYEDFDFGEVEVNSLHLSQNHTTAEDGYYVPSYKLVFSYL